MLDEKERDVSVNKYDAYNDDIYDILTSTASQST